MDNAKPYSQWLKELEEQFKPKTQEDGGGDDQDILKEIESRFSRRLRLNRLSGQVEQEGQPIRVDEFYITLRPQLGLKASKQLTIDLVMQLARENEYSPVAEDLEQVYQQYGDSTVSLLDNIASRYFGTTEALYDIYVKRILTGGVARALNPGCKMDTALFCKASRAISSQPFLIR